MQLYLPEGIFSAANSSSLYRCLDSQEQQLRISTSGRCFQKLLNSSVGMRWSSISWDCCSHLGSHCQHHCGWTASHTHWYTLNKNKFYHGQGSDLTERHIKMGKNTLFSSKKIAVCSVLPFSCQAVRQGECWWVNELVTAVYWFPEQAFSWNNCVLALTSMGAGA